MSDDPDFVPEPDHMGNGGAPDAEEYLEPPNTSHLHLNVDVEDPMTNRILAYAGLIRVVDDVKNEEVRRAGLDLLSNIAGHLKPSHLAAVKGGKV